MKNYLMFVGSERSEDIDQLRMQEYSKARGFTVLPQTLKWKESDNQSYVLVAEREKQLVATMRGEIISDQKLLERKLECPWTFPKKISLPVMLLSRAATSSENRESGLNMLLRYYFLRLAAHHNVPYVLGTFIAGSPRENSLRAMGYEFFENKLGWQQSTYKSHGQVQVVVLDMQANGQQALDYCRSKCQQIIDRFPFEGSLPGYRVVNCL